VDFLIEQTYAADPDEVARAYTQPELYDLIAEVSSLGRPEVLDCTNEDGGKVVVLEVRYRFTGRLSTAARAILDPGKLSWVEHSTHEVARRHVDYRFVPDHYGDRFRASGKCTTRRGPHGGAVRTVEGSVRVKMPLVGRAVERAIVSGLREHLASETAAVERFLAAGP
jgi:Protein of unknown function (DUF2505)